MRRLTLAAAFALLITAAVLRGPDGGTNRNQSNNEKHTQYSR